MYIFKYIYTLFSTDKILDDDLVLVTHRRSQKKYACKGITSSFTNYFMLISVSSFFLFLRISSIRDNWTNPNAAFISDDLKL